MTDVRMRPRRRTAGAATNQCAPPAATARTARVAVSAVLFFVAGAFVALAPPAALRRAAWAQGVPADSVLRDFRRTGDYLLLVQGKQVPVEIYQSERAAALLILSSSLPSPALLSSGSRTAATVNLMKIQKKPDGSIDLLADAVLAPQGPIQFAGEDVNFAVDGRQATLRPQPPLLGLKRAAEVTAHNPEYETGAKSYVVNQQTIAALKKERQPVTVRVFYGSWCPHCRIMVPHALKVERELKGANIHFEYFGLPHNFNNDPEAKKMNVNSVPTGVVFVNGKEVGRIESDAWESPESALKNILTGKG